MKRNAAAAVTISAPAKRNNLEAVTTSGLGRPMQCAASNCRREFIAHRSDAKFCSTRCRMFEHRRRQWEAAAHAPPKSCCWRGPCSCVARPAAMRGGPGWKTVRR